MLSTVSTRVLGYGYRQGALMVRARIAQALARWMFGVTLEHLGAWSLSITASLSIVATALLGRIAMPRKEPSAPRCP